MSRATLKPIVSQLRGAIIKGIAGKLEKYGFDEQGNLVTEKPLSNYDDGIRSKIFALFEAEKIQTKEKYIEYIHNSSRTWLHVLICFKLMEKRRIMSSLIENILSTDIYNDIIPDFNSVNPLAYDEFIIKFEKEIKELSIDDEENDEIEYYQFIYMLRKLANKMALEVPLLFGDYELILIQPDFEDLKNIMMLIAKIEEYEYLEDDFLGWIYQYWVDTDETELQSAKDNSKSSMSENILYYILKSLHEEQTEFGEFYTPRDVVKQIVDDSLDAYKKNNDIKVEEIKILDPACGAGNFLVYAFDVFKKLYDVEHPDWSESKKVENILACNIFGADVQREPLQITALNLWIKAHSYSSVIKIKDLNLYNVNVLKANSLKRWEMEEEFHQMSLFEEEKIEDGFTAEDIGKYLSAREKHNHNNAIEFFKHKFNIIIMNPPYLGIRKMRKESADFLKQNYPNHYINLFEAFIVRAIELLEKGGICGFVSSDTFLTLSSHEKIREVLVCKKQIVELVTLGNVFDGPTVNASIMIFNNSMPTSDTMTRFICDNQEKMILQKEFKSIKGYPIIETKVNGIISNFKKYDGFGKYVKIKQGMISGDNKKYLRYKWEIPEYLRGKRFFPYANGGGYCKYANDIVEYIDWNENGKELRADAKRKYGSESRTIKNVEYFFKGGVTYSEISGNLFSARYYPEGCIFSNKGPCIFSEEIDRYYVLGFCNSKYFNYVAKLLNPTVGFSIGDIERIPFAIPTIDVKNKVIELSKEIVQNKQFLLGFDFTSDFYHQCEIGFGFEKGAKTIKEAYEIYYSTFITILKRIEMNSMEIDELIYNLYGLNEEERRIIDNEICAPIAIEKDILSIENATFNYIKQTIKTRINNSKKLFLLSELTDVFCAEIEKCENGIQLIEEIEGIMNCPIHTIIKNGVNTGNGKKVIYGKSSKDLSEPILVSKEIGGKGKTKELVIWRSDCFILEYQDDDKYIMQNEIRRITDEYFLPKLIRAKEKLYNMSVDVKEKNKIEKDIQLYEECIKTLENWKVVD